MEKVRWTVELMLLSLPLITFVFLEVMDYVTTVEAVSLGARELNPLASHLLTEGKLDTLVYYKAVHTLAVSALYLAGLVMFFGGRLTDNVALEMSGVTALVLFFVVYLAGLLVDYLNTTSLIALIHHK